MSKKYMNSEELFDRSKSRLFVDWSSLLEHLFVEYLTTKDDAKKLIMAASRFMEAEPNLLYLEDPLTIVGDIHGQFFDVKEIFRLGGNPATTKYLFLGDYVDRGAYGIEVLLAIYALKINFPNTIFLLRGNHECRQMTAFHDFRDECIRKYDQEVYELIMQSFDKMPIGCIINGQFLAVHGGISPELQTALDINKLDRFKEPPQYGAICDLLWSDPVDSETGAQDSVWKFNQSRNCSYYFGVQAVATFLAKNNLMSIIRAHEAQFEGFKAYVWANSDFPQVITVFSAPNYCGTYANKGAIMKLIVSSSE